MTRSPAIEKLLARRKVMEVAGGVLTARTYPELKEQLYRIAGCRENDIDAGVDRFAASVRAHDIQLTEVTTISWHLEADGSLSLLGMRYEG